MTAGAVEVAKVDFAFEARGGGGHMVLDGIDLTLNPGSVVALIGPNGSGKSTLLRVIAGLLRATSGRVLLDGTPISGPDPRIGLVFQEPRLLPWRTAAANITYPLELAGWTTRRQEERLQALIALIGLERAAVTARPSELSGGTRTRSPEGAHHAIAWNESLDDTLPGAITKALIARRA